MKRYYLNKYIPLLVISISILTIILIPLRVIAYGYLPVDDALRHAAKVVSGKPWSEILVVRDGIKMDSHPGWHAILSFAHRAFGLDQDGLVVFSLVSLFILFCGTPLFFFRRPEAWLASLLLFSVVTGGLSRIFFGRPYLISMAILLILCLKWRDLRAGSPSPLSSPPEGERTEEKEGKDPLPRRGRGQGEGGYAAIALFATLIALSTWAHASPHLWALPLAAFLLAREYRAALGFAVSAAAGIILGAILTGHPALFLKQTLYHSFLALNTTPLQRMLVSEFQPHGGDIIALIVVCIFLIWRYARGAWDIKCVDNPVFITAALGWVLNFSVCRFWLDWGVPALMVWAAFEFQDAFDDILKEYSWRRVAAAIALAAVFFMSLTSDIVGRWTYNLTTEYISQDDPKQAEWLPAPGGIIYSNDMGVFYQTFFKNPHAPWRYVLGFEPAWMPEDDLMVYRKIQWNYGAAQAFEPWVKKMRPEDRMVIRGSSEGAPKIEGLEWHYIATNTWIGRKSKK